MENQVKNLMLDFQGSVLNYLEGCDTITSVDKLWLTVNDVCNKVINLATTEEKDLMEKIRASLKIEFINRKDVIVEEERIGSIKELLTSIM